jgi:hypothetical protein
VESKKIGWLSPNGEFYPCNYGEHHLFASKNEEEHVLLGCNEFRNDYFVLFISGSLTEKQIQWFNENKIHLHEDQIFILDMEGVFNHGNE